MRFSSLSPIADAASNLNAVLSKYVPGLSDNAPALATAWSGYSWDDSLLDPNVDPTVFSTWWNMTLSLCNLALQTASKFGYQSTSPTMSALSAVYAAALAAVVVPEATVPVAPTPMPIVAPASAGSKTLLALGGGAALLLWLVTRKKS